MIPCPSSGQSKQRFGQGAPPRYMGRRPDARHRDESSPCSRLPAHPDNSPLRIWLRPAIPHQHTTVRMASLKRRGIYVCRASSQRLLSPCFGLKRLQLQSDVLQSSCCPQPTCQGPPPPPWTCLRGSTGSQSSSCFCKKHLG